MSADTTDQPGSWRYFGERELLSSQWLTVAEADVQDPRGIRHEFQLVHLPPIAIALIVDDQERALMMWRQRFPVMSWGYELLGGLINAGESPVAAAAREAEEESGWRPKGEAEHLIGFDPLPGTLTAPTDIYLWRAADKVGEPIESDEVGRIEWVPISRVPELAAKKQLLGGGTLVPLLYYLTTRTATGGK